MRNNVQSVRRCGTMNDEQCCFRRPDRQGVLRLLFVIHCSLYIIHSSCGQSITGAWVGLETEVDSGKVCPLPLYLQLRSDSTCTMSLIDEAARAPRTTWSWNGGRLRIDTATYAPAQLRVTDTELTVSGAFPMRFGGVIPGYVKRDEVLKWLIDRAWQCNGTRMYLHGESETTEGRACMENLKTGQQTVHCWALVARDSALFLVIRGNRTDCSRAYQSPRQVMAASATQLVIRQWTDRGWVTQTWQQPMPLRPKTSCKPVGFQTCSACFYRPFNMAVDLAKKGPPGGYFAIRQVLEKGLPTGLPGQTGLLQIRCVVNYEGQAGQFETNGYGPDYQRKPFDNGLTKQLLSLCQTHFATGWQPGRYRGTGYPLDYAATINIRLVDGRITDVFP